MAYAAVISLKQTIHRLLNSSHISIVSPNREILDFAYKQLTCLQQALKISDNSSSSSKRLNDLDGQIRDAVDKLEDLLEFHVLSQFPSHILCIDQKEVRQEIQSFVETAKKMEEEYIKELNDPLSEEEEEDDDDDDDDDDAGVSSSIDFGVKMVGLSDEFTGIKDHLLKTIRPDDFGVFSLAGRAGTGRTFVAKALFEDIYIRQEQSFDCGAWVTIGPKYQYKEILASILAQIVDDDKSRISGDDERIAEYLCTSLKGRRYLIVLDDIRDRRTWELLQSLFPEQDNGSLILLTTALTELALFANSFYVYEMPSVLDEHFVWGYLRLVMFGIPESLSPELEEAGKKIAKNCKGLPISVAKVIIFLWEAEKTPEYWNKLAADEQNCIFMVDDEISEICKIKEDMQQGNEKLVTALFDFSPATKTIKEYLFPERHFPKMQIVSFYGMAGIGKTTLIKKIFEDASISHRFDHRAWVTLGTKYQSEEILVDILAEIYLDIDKEHLKEDAKLATDLCAKLSNKRCLIVLDDVWNQESVRYLGKLLPNIKGEMLVTTRLLKVGFFGPCDRVYEVRLLNKEESWSLFCQKLFFEELCPPQLEKAGRKIAENCEGLPLLILTVADLLSKAEKTPEYWNEVAEKQNSLFTNAYSKMSKTLLPSYKSLPQHLKPCFLHMGVFPQNYEIPMSKLIKLWIAEGFLEPNPSQNIEDFAAKCLSELVDRSLVMVRKKGADFKTKTCGLHSVFWYLSNCEAAKNKFFHALNTYADTSIQGIKSQRRLCIRNSILLGFKDVRNSLASILTWRSLLCTGPIHRYPLSIYFGFRLLRLLDALSIRFYEFPIEVVKLTHLRYLALTCNGKLPASISKLCNLENLIISQHLSIKSPGDFSYLPIEIWDMKELKHLQITGSDLPDPSCGVVLPNLLTLLDVSARSCTKRVLKGIPNLKRLGIRIELTPNHNGNPFRCLNRISRLYRLESLKCVVVNPELRYDVAPPAPRSMFPSRLKKLSLRGFGYPWEYMSEIGKLQNLEVLKLRRYAFQGPAWETDYSSFCNLKFLSIEDTDLVRWELKIPSIFSVKHISIKHCYKLKELPLFLPNSVEMVEVVDCNPLVVTWAKQMKEKNWKRKLETLQLRVNSSWDDGNLKR